MMIPSMKTEKLYDIKMKLQVKRDKKIKTKTV